MYRFVLEIKSPRPFMQNRLVLLAVQAENNPCTFHVKRLRGKWEFSWKLSKIYLPDSLQIV